MAQSERRQRYQKARNERYKAAGWTGYGQFRQAQRLGYSTPVEYHAAKRGRPTPRAPIAPNPLARRRRLPGGGVVGNLPTGAVGIEVPYTPRAVDALERELRRYRGDRRITFYVGDTPVFKRGMSLRHFLGLFGRGELFGLIPELAAGDKTVPGHTGPITAVSVTLS